VLLGLSIVIAIDCSLILFFETLFKEAEVFCYLFIFFAYLIYFLDLCYYYPFIVLFTDFSLCYVVYLKFRVASKLRLFLFMKTYSAAQENRRMR
jgi:hypothetical protein